MSHQVRFALKLNMYGHPPDTPFQVFQRLAQQAEAVGFDGVYSVDHLFLPRKFLLGLSYADPDVPSFPDCWTGLAALAAVTNRVRLGPQVTPVSMRHPVFIAKMGATLDHISNGRFVLQMGTGWHQEEHTSYGLPYDERFSVRHERMMEGVEVIKRLWTEEQRVSYQGRYFTLDGAPFWPKPVQRPHPPIWFGGMGKKAREAVARHGDAWTPALPHFQGMGSDLYTEGLREVRALAQEHGRDPDAILPAALFATVIHQDRSKAVELAQVLRRREDWASYSLEEMERMGMVIYGTPDDCARSVERYIQAGVRYFTFTFVPITDVEAAMRGMELYASQVLPRFASV
ncbi:MAG: LLM class flavin-dependent oxidoreductase [Dehalococcoidia bacterium]